MFSIPIRSSHRQSTGFCRNCYNKGAAQRSAEKKAANAEATSLGIPTKDSKRWKWVDAMCDDLNIAKPSRTNLHFLERMKIGGTSIFPGRVLPSTRTARHIKYPEDYVQLAKWYKSQTDARASASASASASGY
jgi:hypothetical protein